MSARAGSIWTIVVAAGRGTRFGSTTPKQFVHVAGRRVVEWSLASAAAASDGVVVVVPGDGPVPEFDAETGAEFVVVAGGPTRSSSVRNGLSAVPETASTILVHDAARPLASPDLFRRVIVAIEQGAAAAVPTVPVIDTIRRVDGSSADRSDFEAVQTPQGFRADALRSAHAGGDDATDDATLVAADGGRVVSVEGERWNIKLTEPTDDVVAAALLQERVT